MIFHRAADAGSGGLAQDGRGMYLEKTAAITGVPAHLIAEAARRYAGSGASMCVHGLGVTEHRWGSHGVIALVNLALATGNIGRPGTGINFARTEQCAGRIGRRLSAHSFCRVSAVR
ncbi:MAG: molybdopterin-dependent oxidoreductase [Nitrospiraceae bacterium]